MFFLLIFGLKYYQYFESSSKVSLKQKKLQESYQHLWFALFWTSSTGNVATDLCRKESSAMNKVCIVCLAFSPQILWGRIYAKIFKMALGCNNNIHNYEIWICNYSLPHKKQQNPFLLVFSASRRCEHLQITQAWNGMYSIFWMLLHH